MLELTYLGKFHAASGDLFYLDHPDGRQARVYVDSIGETWVDERRIPAGGYFHSERVKAWRSLNGAVEAERVLREQGYDSKRSAPFAHLVHEREI